MLESNQRQTEPFPDLSRHDRCGTPSSHRTDPVPSPCSQCGGYSRLRHSEVSPHTQNGVAHSLAQSRVDASRLCLSVEAQRGFVETEFLSSGSPQGLSSPMLVVIFLSRHCSLLCSPSFLIILSAIYQTVKSERTKKRTCRFFAFCLWKNCFVCSLFPCRKKSSLSVEMIQMI